MSGRFAIATGLALTLCIAAASVVRAAGGGAQEAVVSAGSIRRRVVASGYIEPRGGTARVNVSVTGTVRWIAVRVGDRVDRDSTLALVDRGTEPPLTLTAPVAGRIVASRLVVGDSLPFAATAFEIADTDRLDAVFAFDERDAREIRVGDEIEVGGVRAGSRASVLHVSAVAPRVDDVSTPMPLGPRARGDHPVRRVWAELPTSNGFAPGQPIEARFALPPVRAAATVPRGAIVVADGHAYVETPLWGPFTRRVRVTLGEADDDVVATERIAIGTRVRLHEEMRDE